MRLDDEVVSDPALVAGELSLGEEPVKLSLGKQDSTACCVTR